MTTEPISMRDPASSRFNTQDTAGGQQTLGEVRAGWPVQITQAGAGTQNDGVTWDAQSAVIIEAGISLSAGGGLLTGGTALIEVQVSGQSAYSGADGWQPVAPTINWRVNAVPFEKTALLGKAHILTVAGAGGARVRVTVTGADTAEVVVFVAPVAANPACPP